MHDDKFETNLAKLMTATLYTLVSMNAARDLLGKSYFSLGVNEKAVVDQAVLGLVGANFQQLTPETLQAQALRSVGFQGTASPMRSDERTKQ
jgi:hypothetical protein